MANTAGRVAQGVLFGLAGAWIIVVILIFMTKILGLWAKRLQRQINEVQVEYEELHADVEDPSERAAKTRAFMSTKLISGHYSQPDDPDLIVYLREVTLTQVAVEPDDKSIYVMFTGGWGYVHDAVDDHTVMFPKPQDEDDEVENVLGEFILKSNFPGMPDTAFGYYARAVEIWYEDDTPLMVCIAPGMAATVLEEEDQTRWLPFPLS